MNKASILPYSEDRVVDVTESLTWHSMVPELARGSKVKSINVTATPGHSETVSSATLRTIVPARDCSGKLLSVQDISVGAMATTILFSVNIDEESLGVVITEAESGSSGEKLY